MSPHTRMQHVTISHAHPDYKFIFLCQAVFLLAAAELVLGGIPDGSFQPELDHHHFILVCRQFYFLAFICLHEIYRFV